MPPGEVKPTPQRPTPAPTGADDARYQLAVRLCFRAGGACAQLQKWPKSSYYDGTTSRGFIATPKPKTTTVLAISPNPPCCDETVTFTATVAPEGGGSVPTGTVTFMDGTVELGVGNLENGTATFLGTLGLTGTHILGCSI